MLYTTYFSKMNKLPKDCINLIITRFPPKWLDVNKLDKTIVIKKLSPYESTLLQYKKDNDWDKYVVNFTKQMKNGADMITTLEKIAKQVSDGKDIALICYEKDYIHCHRYLLAQKLKDDYGIEWKEL